MKINAKTGAILLNADLLKIIRAFLHIIDMNSLLLTHPCLMDIVNIIAKKQVIEGSKEHQFPVRDDYPFLQLTLYVKAGSILRNTWQIRELQENYYKIKNLKKLKEIKVCEEKIFAIKRTYLREAMDNPPAAFWLFLNATSFHLNTAEILITLLCHKSFLKPANEIINSIETQPQAEKLLLDCIHFFKYDGLRHLIILNQKIIDYSAHRAHYVFSKVETKLFYIPSNFYASVIKKKFIPQEIASEFKSKKPSILELQQEIQTYERTLKEKIKDHILKLMPQMECHFTDFFTPIRKSMESVDQPASTCLIA